MLDRKWSDHCPILLHANLVDYRPSSFKTFNFWLHMEGFDEVFIRAISEFVVDPGWNKFVLFKNKLKFIKSLYLRLQSLKLRLSWRILDFFLG